MTLRRRWRLAAPTLAGLTLAACAVLGLGLGEVALGLDDFGKALTQPGSGPGEILWSVRAPRTLCAILTGGCLGLAGALMQGQLRNPLADPGVLGVSAFAGLGAALAIATGLTSLPFAVETASLLGALVAAAALLGVSLRRMDPQSLILSGVAVSSFGGALTSLVFNLSPSPVSSSEILTWMLGSVENRGWPHVLGLAAALVAASILAAFSRDGLRAMTLGEETARTLGVDLALARRLSLLAAALATGAAVAVAGVIGFVGLAAPHLARAFLGQDPARILAPSAVAGGLVLVVADLLTRIAPTETELRLGVLTALFGAPAFALIAWRAGRAWRS